MRQIPRPWRVRALEAAAAVGLYAVVGFFVVLLALPVLTHSNGFWIPQPAQAQTDAEHK